MKLKEVLQKVTENLQLEKDLKSKIRIEQDNIQALADKIKESELKLESANLQLAEFKNELLEELKCEASSIKGNIRLNISMNEQRDVITQFEYKFMGNAYKIFNDQYIFNGGKNALQVPEIIEELYKKYLEVGCKLLNMESINKLQDIESLYNKNPKKAADGFVNLKVDKIVKTFENKLTELRSDFNVKLEELENVEEKIQKSKNFKSSLLKKLFDRRAKLEEKQNKLFSETEEIGMSIKNIEMELSDKSQIKNDATIYVRNQINSLFVILKLIKDFEVVKYRLSSFENKNIYFVKQEIRDMGKNKLIAMKNLEDLKSMLKLNRKVNKETISMAFKDKEFGIELDNADPGQIKDNQKAYDLLQAKYDQIIADKIKKII